jgi:heterodisulfide reductase subunit A
MQSKSDAVLVIGGGVAGIRASLDLAEMGRKVYLCDRNPNIGGTLVQLDKWFPDNHCGMCKMLPIFSRDDSSQFCLRRGLIHPNVEILARTEVDKIDGEAGAFTVSLKSVPSGVDQDLCIGCGLCVDVCPVEVANDFNEGLVKRKAIFLRNPWQPASSYVVDWASCTKCGACVEKCPTSAINLSEEESGRRLEVGAVILSTGFEEFDPELATQYGHQRFPNVVTSIELERILSPGGPTEGKLLRPSDQKVPQSVAFLQCVGSRDTKRNYCSSACCMYALKEAILIKMANPQVDVEIFYMDLRTFGKGYYRYYEQAKKLGIKFTRSRVPVVKQDFKNNDLLLTASGEDGSLTQRQAGMVVLSVGQTPSPRFGELAEALGLAINEHNFCATSELAPSNTTREGIYVCGSASGPKDIADTLIESSAAAGLASQFSMQVEAAQAAEELDSTEEAATAVFVCDCGNEVSSVVDMGKLAEASKAMPSVVHVEEIPFLCKRDALESIKGRMAEHGANRAVFATCAPFATRRLASDTGVDPSLMQAFNLREEVAWSNKDNPEAATKKAVALTKMAVERVRLQEISPMSAIETKQAALVIGGGMAGMVTALSIAEAGFEVHLVEREAELGGNAKGIHTTLEGSDVQALLKGTIEKVENNPKIHVYKGTEISEVTGFVGDFKVRFAKEGEEAQPEPEAAAETEAAEGEDEKAEVKQEAQSVLEVGAIIVATGGEGHKPTEYLYGQNEKVVTQEEFEKRLANDQLGNIKLVAMIQCVESRGEARPYCSRVCCSQALKNALRLKEKYPEAEVVVLYRDLMSYGFMEQYYTLAREKGVLFTRYDVENKPQVTAEGGKLKIQAEEPALRTKALRTKLTIEPDWLVLSVPVVPGDQAQLTEILEVERNEDGFFREAEVKFRPVDFARDGLFLCGLAHSPRTLTETITQSQAAAERAASILSRPQLHSGRVVSEVKERWCAGCEMCIPVCPYGARYKDTEKGIVLVREALCQGCGACVVTCPSGAARLRGLSDTQVLSMTDVAV